MKPYISLPIIVVLALVGCADVVTNAQKEVISAKIGMDAFVHLERANGPIIKQEFPGQYKAIHNYSNLVRRNGQQWIRTADALIDAYAQSKSDTTKTQMDNALAVLSAAATQSTFYVAQINTAIGGPTPTPTPK